MNDTKTPGRLDPKTTDATAAAIILGCSTQDIGPCVRCQGLTARYGRQAQSICPACRAKEPA
ncbi:hypothetical protein ACH4VR_19785 [Streptomyces sp. NPDC020883]|uniref:hypothetical protein n=1 Tax=Streptomyces sp. NPDC020883 TaxID=3365099 RepID=UPI0037AC1D6E